MNSTLPTPSTLSTRFYPWLAVGTAALALVSVAANSILRVSVAGPVCLGHWPLCQGQWWARFGSSNLVENMYQATALLFIPLLAGLVITTWQTQRRARWLMWPVSLALGAFAMQFILGGVNLPAQAVALHTLNYALGLLMVGLLTVAAVVAWRMAADPRLAESLIHLDRISRLAVGVTIGTGLLLVLGALVNVSGATTACTTWPLCNGLQPPASALEWLSLSHRYVAAGVGALMLVSLVLAWRWRSRDLPVTVAASVTAMFFVGQVFISVDNLLNGYPLHLRGLHTVTGLLIWVAGVVFAVLAMQYVRLSPLAQTAPVMVINWRTTLADYLVLTKPIIMLLLLFTTGTAMVVAGNGWPPAELFWWTMLGGALASGGASALNQVIDHRLDQFMTRTSRRPIAQGRVSPAAGLAFGLALNIASFYVLAVFVNLTAALLAMLGSVYYVIGYTMLLKKTSTQNIVIGGGAGAIPPMVGWAAVTGSVDAAAIFMFALVFFWTPPHFWALALIKKNDYARAGVPMLPVVLGEAETRREILLYTLVVVALSWLFTPAGVAGLVYLAIAVVLGLGFVAHAVWLWRVGSNQVAWRTYKYSSTYLALMFAALVLDRFFYITV